MIAVKHFAAAEAAVNWGQYVTKGLNSSTTHVLMDTSADLSAVMANAHSLSSA